MTFLEFYSNHFLGVSVLLIVLSLAIICVIVALLHRLFKTKTVKTPWFEIAPDSVKDQESEDMGKTRLLLKRQFDFIDNFMLGIAPTLQAIQKEVVYDCMQRLFGEELPPKTHLTTCFIESSTNDLVEELKNYINGLLVINHIGTNKEKIENYAKNHTGQVMAIARKSYCDNYSKLSGEICTDVKKYWKTIGIEDPTKWVEDNLTRLLLDLSELRYSDFEKINKNN